MSHTGKKVFAGFILSLTTMTASAQWWEDCENNWPEWTPMYWMEEMLGNNDEQCRAQYYYWQRLNQQRMLQNGYNPYAMARNPYAYNPNMFRNNGLFNRSGYNNRFPFAKNGMFKNNHFFNSNRFFNRNSRFGNRFNRSGYNRSNRGFPQWGGMPFAGNSMMPSSGSSWGMGSPMGGAPWSMPSSGWGMGSPMSGSPWGGMNPMTGFNPMTGMNPMTGFNPMNGMNPMTGFNPMNNMNPMGGMNSMSMPWGR